MEQVNHFDDNLRKSFEGFSPEPPADAWFAIRQSVAAPARTAAFPLLLRVAAAIVLLVVGAISVWMLSPSETLAPSAVVVDAPHAEPSETASGSSNIHIYSEEPASASSYASETNTDQTRSAGQTQYGAIVTRESETMPGSPHQMQPPAAAILHKMASIAPRIPVQAIENNIARIQSGAIYSPQSNLLSLATEQRGALRVTGSTATPSVVFGLHVAPRYNDRHISGTNFLSQSNPFTGSSEEQSISVGYGFTAAVQLSPRLAIQTGVGYTSMDQRINHIEAFSHVENQPFYDVEYSPGYGHPQQIITSLGVIHMGNPGLYFADNSQDRVMLANTKLPFDVPDDPKFLALQGQQLTQSFSFVEVPLIARYRIVNHRHFGLHLKMGVAGNFLIKNEVSLSYLDRHNEVIGQTFGMRDFSYSGIGGLSLTFPLGSRLQLFVEPTAQMLMQSIIKEDPALQIPKTYPYNFSVYSGISFAF